MQGAIVYSNAVTTVSPTYAEEALSGGAAGWLQSTLAKPDLRSKFQVRTSHPSPSLICVTPPSHICRVSGMCDEYSLWATGQI